MSQQSPKTLQQMLDLGMSAMNGVRDGSVSPEKAHAVADLMVLSIKFAKAEITVLEAAGELDKFSG